MRDSYGNEVSLPAYLNQGGILYPSSDFELQIYTRLPADLQANRF